MIKGLNPLIGFTLRNWRSVSSSWLDRLRISDRKFVNHTTEMILWSMILKIHDFNEKFIKVNVYKPVCFIFQKDSLVQWNWKKMLPKCSISYIFYQIYPLFASSYFSFKDFSKHQWSFQYLLNYRATYNHSATLCHALFWKCRTYPRARCVLYLATWCVKEQPFTQPLIYTKVCSKIYFLCEK